MIDKAIAYVQERTSVQHEPLDKAIGHAARIYGILERDIETRIQELHDKSIRTRHRQAAFS